MRDLQRCIEALPVLTKAAETGQEDVGVLTRLADKAVSHLKVAELREELRLRAVKESGPTKSVLVNDVATARARAVLPKKMRVAELRAALERLGQPSGGRKLALAARLETAHAHTEDRLEHERDAMEVDNEVSPEARAAQRLQKAGTVRKALLNRLQTVEKNLGEYAAHKLRTVWHEVYKDKTLARMTFCQFFDLRDYWGKVWNIA